MSGHLFEIGHVVRLNSGGLQMTVEALDGDYVHCVWTDRQHKIMREQLPASCLSRGDQMVMSVAETHESEEDA